MRFVVALALLAAACGNKERSEPTPIAANPDEKFINQELGPHLAQIEAATVSLGKIGAGDVVQGATLGRQLVTARSYLAGFLVGASKLSPPSAWKASYESLTAIATDMAAAVDELQMATDANRAEMFTEAHGKLAVILKRHADWKTALQNGLASAGIKQAPLPTPPEPTSKPPIDDTPYPCGGPCPCTATSIEKTGDVITKCILSRDYGVSGVHCADGPVLFDAKTGELAECASAAMFTPYPPEKPGTPPERTAICGVGPVTKAAGAVTSCVLDADLVVGDTKVAKTTRVFFEGGAVVRAATTDGKTTCFDATGKVIGCT